MKKSAREIHGDQPGWQPVVMVSGRQTSGTQMEWRVDWHPKIQQAMTPEEWRAFNECIEKIGSLIEEASRRPPTTKGH